MTSRKIPTYGKLDMEECIKNFRVTILNNLTDINRLKKDLITSGKLAHIDKTFIRGFSWMIYLGILPLNQKVSLKSWIDEITNQRKNVKKLIKSNTVNKLKGDPLGGISTETDKTNKQWNDFLTQSEIIKMIKFDVERTNPSEKLFKEPYIKDLETTVLSIFAKNHKEISYRQGMNEILSIIINAMYPYYGKSPNDKYTPELFDKWAKNPAENAKDIYYFFLDENEFGNDVLILFENLMIKYGLAKFFEDDSKDKKKSPYFIKRVKHIIHKKLSVLDRAVFSHFQNQNLDYGMVFQRWFKCLFKREFPFNDTCTIWDYILAHELEKNSGMLLYVDYIVLAMIEYVKNNLLSRDSNGIFEIFLNYPKISQITTILNMADGIARDLAMNRVEELPKEEEKKPEIKVETKNPELPKPQPPAQPQPQPQPQITNTNVINNPIGNIGTMGQVNPLLLNPNLMVNPNLQNNMMLAMMMQQQALQNQLNNMNINNNNNINATSNINKEVSSSEALKELKEIGNKYKNVMSAEDKKRMDFLIDSLTKKL
jgi:hypothetical protein